MERWKWSGKPRSSADNALKAFLNNWQSFIWVFIPLCFLSWCVGSDIENLPLTRGWQGDAAWAGCEPQDLDVSCEMEQKYCWLKETAPCATFQRHCSSVPQKHLRAPFPGPVCVLRGENSPAVLQNWAEPDRVKFNYWR